MSKIQVNSQIELDVETILAGIAQLDSQELEKFSFSVMALNARRKAPSVSLEESQLLTRINHGVPTEVRMRYQLLNEKLHEDQITADEHRELLGLIDQIEVADAERLRALIELARVRGTSVEAVMQQLQIRQPTYG